MLSVRKPSSTSPFKRDAHQLYVVVQQDLHGLWWGAYEAEARGALWVRIRTIAEEVSHTDACLAAERYAKKWFRRIK